LLAHVNSDIHVVVVVVVCVTKRSSDLALEFIIFAGSKILLMGPAWRIVTLHKIPILGIKGFEVRGEFHSVVTNGYHRIPGFPLGNRQTSDVNRAWPFPEGNCVYGFVYFIVKYDKKGSQLRLVHSYQKVRWRYQKRATVMSARINDLIPHD
jgi:hypothetical protein